MLQGVHITTQILRQLKAERDSAILPKKEEKEEGGREKRPTIVAMGVGDSFRWSPSFSRISEVK